MEPLQLKKEDLKKALALIKAKGVKELFFSGGNYQSHVVDAKQDLWPFLQVADDGSIADGLCDCEQSEKERSCPHLAAAWMTIQGKEDLPLHVRFRRSLWDHLCRVCAQRFGDDLDQMTKEGNVYRIVGKAKATLFEVKGKNPTGKRKLAELIDKRVRETEETSIKFSNLAAEEIVLWKQGRPSFELRYELSFWSDLAKWWMNLQESHAAYTVNFAYNDEDVPMQVHIGFSQVEVSVALDEAMLLQLVPSLETVSSPLFVQTMQESAIDSVVYDEKRCQLTVVPKKEATQAAESIAKARRLGSWWYLPREGFISSEQHALLAKPVISEDKIASILTRYPQLLRRYLKGTTLDDEPLDLSYSLRFDAKWNLHIEAYAVNKGDLTKGASRLYGLYVYLQGKGFCRVRDPLFKTSELTVPQEEIGTFVSQQRSFLNRQSGFSTHLAVLQRRLSYSVRSDGSLLFENEADAPEALTHDFGDWIYLEGQGFYAKLAQPGELQVAHGLEVPAQTVGSFLSEHRAELEWIEGFFSQQCPVLKAGVEIELQGSDKIAVTPRFILKEGIAPDKLRYYDNYVYEKGKGFSSLPIDVRQPVRYRRKQLIEREKMIGFLHQDLPLLLPFAFHIDPRLLPPQRLTVQVEGLRRVGPGQLVAKLCLASEKGKVLLSQVWEAANAGKSYLFTEAGTLELQDARMAWLKSIKAAQFEEDGVALTAFELLRLSAQEDLHAPAGDSDDEEKSRALLFSILRLSPLDAPQPLGLQCQLRPYQEAGLQWLWFLYSYGLSGLLCDEMGLGKTLQAMALMASVQTRLHHKQNNYLIVCPTSVMYHWEDKLKQFFPSMPSFSFHGAARTLKPYLKQGGALITSYGILRSEQETLRAIPFEVAIFDEVQIAKNHLSKTHLALASLQSKMRLGLTGTPIENRLRELKALFDLVLPGYMPGEAQYRELFVLPIEREGDDDKKQLLSRLIKPFVLRRKKSEVLTELPEKVEEIAYCEMTPEQMQMYQEAIDKARDSVVKPLQDDKTPIPYLSLFQLLARLKQICDHPAVALKDAQRWRHYTSGKWQLFVELLSEARESEQKVVVFSHYLAMLDIVESYLKEQKIGFASIRGETQKRKEELQRFQEDPNCVVFVGSLQAVGLGVELTAASVVIHYDRWWNAARENQATDRVHRMGQQRGVQVFKLVTKGSIEEHIHALIEEKGQLLEEIVASDDASQLKRFDRKELLALLRLSAAKAHPHVSDT